MLKETVKTKNSRINAYMFTPDELGGTLHIGIMVTERTNNEISYAFGCKWFPDQTVELYDTETTKTIQFPDIDIYDAVIQILRYTESAKDTFGALLNTHVIFTGDSYEISND